MKAFCSLLVVVGLAFYLVGCETVTGGGWIVSGGDPLKKATFGLNLSCTDIPGFAVVEGYIEYHDQAKMVPDPKGKMRQLAFNGRVPDFGGPINSTCALLDSLGSSEFGLNYGEVPYVGTYTPQPITMGPGGDFVVVVQDNGQKGPDKGDIITVTLSGGVFDGYSNTGELQGGNISIAMP